MAHVQKPDFVFRRNGRVHLNRQGRHFSWLLAAEVCASAVVMLDTPRSEVVWRVLATHSIRQFPLHFPSRASPCAIRFQTHSTFLRNVSNIVSGCTLSQPKKKIMYIVTVMGTSYLYYCKQSSKRPYPVLTKVSVQSIFILCGCTLWISTAQISDSGQNCCHLKWYVQYFRSLLSGGVEKQQGTWHGNGQRPKWKVYCCCKL